MSFPIVGIGASAGGLESFSELLALVPAGTGMAYVFVQHLHPGHASHLARLSQFLTRNPRKWLILSPRYGANGLRLSPQIDFDRGRFGVVVALVKTSRDDGGSVEPAPRVE
jgi:hypothetical protein